MTWVVQRQKPDSTATMGELLVDGVHACWTMEPDEPIQAGTYRLEIDYSPDFKRLMPHVMGVPPCPPDRGIRLHWGSIPANTKGCTLTGETEGKDFLGHTVDEFNILFTKLQDALAQGPMTITYQDYDPNLPSVPSGVGTGNANPNGGTT